MSKVIAAAEPAFFMSREEYRAWAEQQPRGRFERMNGIVVAMAPERSRHNQRKMLAWLALRQAVRQAGLPCHVYGHGMTVEAGDSDYEPDAVMHCGAKLPDDAIAVPDPLVIVEVLSPSSSGTDRVWKLDQYFKLPSLRHYLIIWANRQQVLHHRRTASGLIENEIVTTGQIPLDPPGITIAVADIYAE
jgi:Uma2 family endonuclease